MPDPKKYIEIYNKMKSARGNFNSLFEEIKKRVLPDAGDFNTKNPSGKKNNLNIYDSTAEMANKLLSSAITGSLMNPSIKWFSLNVKNANFSEDFETTKWLDEVVEVMLNEMNNPEAGFRTAISEATLEFSAFGTGIMFVTINKNNELMYRSMALGETYLDEGENGKVDKFYRKFEWTATKIVSMWGIENVSEEIMKAFEKDHTKKFEILHVIQPRDERDIDKDDNKNMPFESIYLEINTMNVLSESGFNEQPMYAMRFSKHPTEIYGRGAGSTNLPDIMMIQAVSKAIGTGTQLAVAPPTVEEDDSVVTPSRLVPHGRLKVRAGKPFPKTLNIGGDVAFGLQYLQMLQAQIQKGFHTDLLQQQVGQNMTATEFIRRSGERGQLLMSVLSRYVEEGISPIINRTYAILDRLGKLPPKPVEIQQLEATGVKLGVNYTSPVAHLQKQVEVEGFINTLGTIQPFIDADPTLVKAFDTDKMLKDIAVINGMELSWLKDEETLQKEREEIAQQQQQQQLAQNVGQAAPGIKAISEVANAQQANQ